MIFNTSFFKHLAVSSLFIFPMTASAEFLELGNKNFAKTKLKESRWDFALTADLIRYAAKFPAFDGQYEKVEDTQSYDLYGPSLSFGREFHVGGSVFAQVKVGALFLNNTEERKGLGSKDVQVEISDLEVTHSSQMGYAGVDLGYLFETKYVNFLPFIGAEYGVGKMTANKNYVAQAIPTISNSDEKYDFRVVEEMNFSRISLGVKFISFKGVYSVFKVSSANFATSKRTINGSYKKYGNTNTVRADSEEKSPSDTSSEIVGSFGFGYLF